MQTEKNAFRQSLLFHYGTCLELYKGKGILTLKGGRKMKCTFEAGQLATGDVLLLCDFRNLIPFIQSIPMEGFEGTTSEGFQIYTSKCLREINYLPDIPEHSSGTWAAFHLRKMFVQLIEDDRVQTAHFGITNFELNHELSLNLVSSGNEAHLSIKPVDGYNKKILQLETMKGIDVTCEVVGNIPSNGGITQLEREIDDLCYILSVARGTKIQWVYYTLYKETGKCISRTHFSRITKPYCPLAAIDPRNIKDTKTFIESVYSNYIAKKESYKLNKGTIDAYLDAKAENDYLQLRGLKLAVVIEMLKAVFLELPNSSLREHIIDEKQFQKLTPDIKASIKDVLKSSVNGSDRKAIYEKIRELNRRSFGYLLEGLLKHIGLEVKEEEIRLFIACRNKLVHKGRFYCETATPDEHKKCKPFPTTKDEYFFLIHFLDKIFLKLLGYNGLYIDWSSPEKPVRKEKV